MLNIWDTAGDEKFSNKNLIILKFFYIILFINKLSFCNGKYKYYALIN